MEYVWISQSKLEQPSLIIEETTVSFEEALLSPEPNPIMTQILSRFVLNLRPGTRNLRCAWSQPLLRRV